MKCMRLKQHGIVLLLLLGLVAGAAAATEGSPPVLPHEFYGNVMIGGSAAPAGTEITATIDGVGCGSVVTTEAGRYGSPDPSLGKRLIVTAAADQEGAPITFLVNGRAAKETANFTSDAVTVLDLSVAAEATPTTPPGGSTGGGGGGGRGTSGSPGSEVVYEPEAPTAPVIFTKEATLTASTAGVVLEPVVVRTEDEVAALTIPEGTTALDAGGNPLTSVTCTKVDPAEVPPAPPGASLAIALSCGPDGATFDPPISLTYTLSEDEWARIDEGLRPTVMWYNPESGEWQEIAATVDPATRTITAEVSHFSIFALAWRSPEATPAPTTEATPVPDGEPAAFPVWVIGIVIVLVIAVAAYVLMRRR